MKSAESTHLVINFVESTETTIAATGSQGLTALHHRGSRLLLSPHGAYFSSSTLQITIFTTDTCPQLFLFPFAIARFKVPLLPDRVSDELTAAGVDIPRHSLAVKIDMDAPTVSASTGVTRTLLPKLSKLIEGEHNLQSGVKRDIAFLKDELIKLRARVEEEGHRRKRYRFDGPSSQVVVRVDPRLPALFVEAERLVGIDGPGQKIIELLENDGYGQQQLKVVSIVGFGGLGKTTLANQVYQKIKEDTRIGRDDLIWRWIAEGFIAEARGQTADQVALSYFNELINRSLIQPVEILFDGQVEECREHDMVLELIVSLSAEENFASIVEGKSYNAGGHKIRRLSIQSKHVGDEVMQEIVGSLFQLTFLSISSKAITELPENIGDLRHLQTLDIRGSRITKLPSSTSRLQKLVRLLVSTHVEFPDQIGDLQALQELSRINHFSINFVEDLRRLTKLKRLGMDLPDNREKLGGDMGRYEEALKSSLSEMGKHGLQSLDICATGFLEEELIDIMCCTLPCLQKLALYRFHLSNLPKQMVSLVNLTHLSIWVGRIKQEDLCIIGDMPALLFAELHVKHSPDERLTISGQRFLCLKEFKFSNDFFSSGGGLEMLFLQEAMPELRRLHLQFRAQEAESKMGFEFSFEHLASLEHITVTVHSGGAAMSRVEAAKAAVREAARIHPGNPTLDLHVDWY
nr:unnamed protein product [Digitaria exilis]